MNSAWVSGSKDESTSAAAIYRPRARSSFIFAAKYRSPLYTWTAGLNHLKSHMNLAAEFALPKGICIEPSGIYAGRGEDDPILSQRLLREGWKLRQMTRRML